MTALIPWDDTLRTLGYSDVEIRDLASKPQNRLVQDRVPPHEDGERLVNWERTLARLYPEQRVELRYLLQLSLYRCFDLARQTFTHLATVAYRWLAFKRGRS